jgi:hypothetical protein
MITMAHLSYNKPTIINNTNMIAKNTNRLKKLSKSKRKLKEQTRLSAKSKSPGVPTNTCPYIDLAITMIGDLSEAYERLRTKGEHAPMIDEVQQHAIDTLEYIRKANETLRDNSAYWYNKYKDTL